MPIGEYQAQLLIFPQHGVRVNAGSMIVVAGRHDPASGRNECVVIFQDIAEPGHCSTRNSTGGRCRRYVNEGYARFVRHAATVFAHGPVGIARFRIVSGDNPVDARSVPYGGDQGRAFIALWVNPVIRHLPVAGVAVVRSVLQALVGILHP